MSVETWLVLVGTLIMAGGLAFEVYKWRNGGK